MQAFPHIYSVSAAAGASSNVSLDSEGLPSLAAAPPAEFDGPGDIWSPETLLMAAVASCMVLSFKAIARASKFDWHAIDVRSEGTLDREDRITRFTRVVNHVTLDVPTGTDVDKAEKLLHKAEGACLISNSLNAEVVLDCRVTMS